MWRDGFRGVYHRAGRRPDPLAHPILWALSILRACAPLPSLPELRNNSAPALLIGCQLRSRVDIMTSLVSRNDLIRAIALISVVAFPLLAAAQLPSKPGQSADAVAPADSAPVKTAATRDACAEEHWPNFSAACLRGPAARATPRLVSMAAASPQDAAAPAVSAKRIAVAEPVQASAPVRKPKKARLAAHRHERRSSMAYAANSEPVAIAPPSW